MSVLLPSLCIRCCHRDTQRWLSAWYALPPSNKQAGLCCKDRQSQYRQETKMHPGGMCNTLYPADSSFVSSTYSLSKCTSRHNLVSSTAPEHTVEPCLCCCWKWGNAERTLQSMKFCGYIDRKQLRLHSGQGFNFHSDVSQLLHTWTAQ